MGTAEIIIVFSALMALVALTTIGIDWIGKPLKHRRFIPRMYRFEDEKLPIDAYGHTDFSLEEAHPQAVGHVPLPYMQPAPVVVAQVPPLSPVLPIAAAGAADTVAVPIQRPAAPPMAPAATAAGAASASASASSTSAFSDSLAATTSGSTPAVSGAGLDSGQWRSTGLVPEQDPGPAKTPTRTAIQTATTAGAWTPGMPLDTTIDDRKPNLATKAQRFWKSTAEALGSSHFDAEDVGRMQAGKAPRRSNPRTGRTETMQLTGLRQASRPDEVQMRWPEDATDPWNAT